MEDGQPSSTVVKTLASTRCAHFHLQLQPFFNTNASGPGVTWGTSVNCRQTSKVVVCQLCQAKALACPSVAVKFQSIRVYICTSAAAGLAWSGSIVVALLQYLLLLLLVLLLLLLL